MYLVINLRELRFCDASIWEFSFLRFKHFSRGFLSILSYPRRSSKFVRDPRDRTVLCFQARWILRFSNNIDFRYFFAHLKLVSRLCVRISCFMNKNCLVVETRKREILLGKYSWKLNKDFYLKIETFDFSSK